MHKYLIMKKIALFISFACISSVLLAQYHNMPPIYNDQENLPPQNGFKKENLYTGGSLALGFGSYSFNVGGTPEIGYSLTPWLDAGIAVNLNYTSVRADPYYNNNTRQRRFNYGGGPYVRVYPLNQFFIQGQFEHNWIDYTLTDMGSGLGSKYGTQSNSFLAGIGYAQRIIGQSNFYTVIMMDLLTDPSSPYRDVYSNVALPVFRAGFNFYINTGKGRRK